MPVPGVGDRTAQKAVQLVTRLEDRMSVPMSLYSDVELGPGNLSSSGIPGGA